MASESGNSKKKKKTTKIKTKKTAEKTTKKTEEKTTKKTAEKTTKKTAEKTTKKKTVEKTTKKKTAKKTKEIHEDKPSNLQLDVPVVFDNKTTSEQSQEEKKEPRQDEDVPPLTEEEKKKILRNAREYLNSNIRLISACQDEQQTADCSNVTIRFGMRKAWRSSMSKGYDGGACTSALLKTLYNYHDDPKMPKAPKWINLLHEVRTELKDKGYKQVPALTSSRPVSMKDEFSIIPRNHNGKRIALVIGIKYEGKPWELPGCHNDCYAMIKYLKTIHGFQDEDITVLMDDGNHTEPTRENIVKAFHRFSFNVEAGDAAFFHFSGHGSEKKDESGDEKERGMDQTLLPVDVMEKGDIIDDEIFRILLIPLPRGSQLTAIVDCCHSGTIFDLPFEFIGDSKYEDGNEMELRKATFPHMTMVRKEKKRINQMKEFKARDSVIERAIVKPLQPPRKVDMSTIGLRIRDPTEQGSNKGSQAFSIGEGSAKSKTMEKIEDPPVEFPYIKRGDTRDNSMLMLVGCMLMCLNPVKLMKSIS